MYERLGLRPLINAKGTYTNLSGSLLPREVADQMRQAARQYVSIPELLEKSGEHLARLLQCEAALVTSGAAGALTLGTAACLTGDDEEKARRLPDTLGMKNEVIIQKTHRFSYDHAIRNVGIRLIEVEDRAELEARINSRTALMFFLNYADPKGKIHHEEWIEIGKKHKVPTFIDCAADVPPVENLTRYTRMGFDLVTFSGGKALRARAAVLRAAARSRGPDPGNPGEQLSYFRHHQPPLQSGKGRDRRAGRCRRALPEAGPRGGVAALGAAGRQNRIRSEISAGN